MSQTISDSAPQSPIGYSNLQIALHWAVAALFLFNYIVSDGMGRALRNFSQTGMNESTVALLHIIGGSALLVLMLLRVVVRLRQGAPALPQGPGWMHRAAHLGHVALYAVLFALPLSGLAAWFGGIKPAGEAHELLINAALVLIIGHIVMALLHQFVLKDGLLDRMRPGRG